jgi:hypothetical protein
VRTVQDVLNAFPVKPEVPLPRPAYHAREDGSWLCLGVESMRRHMTDEGFQVVKALEWAGYRLAGKDFPIGENDVRKLVEQYHPGTVVIQDKREWMGITADRSRDPAMQFRNVDVLKERPDIFKLTIVKDAQHDSQFHREAAEEIGCHGWVVYYHPDIVCRLAPYVRRDDVVRTYHTVDREIVPAYSADRDGCLLSGARSRVYPLRERLWKFSLRLRLETLSHPGYHRSGSATPEFLKILSRFKVAICTSSVFGYALRKIIEATAAGCRVLTDLPTDEVLPYIDGNLTRIDQADSIATIEGVLRQMLETYDPERQDYYSTLAKKHYDYREMGIRLASDIEQLRRRHAVAVGGF